MSRLLLLAAAAMALLTLSCGSRAQVGGQKMSLLDFIRERRDRRYTQTPRKVLAFYYTWYGRPERHGNWVHWGVVKPEEHDISASTHYPSKGAYDSHDPEIIDWHIDLAQSNGIDAFIATWWGQNTFDDRALRVVLERAAEKDFSVSVYWETAPGSGDEQIDKAVDDLLYILNEYGSHPAFLKLDGKPVIFVYGRVMGQVPLEAWPAIISRTEERYDGDFLLIADGYNESYARALDGIHTYNICGWVQGKTPEELHELAGGSFKGAVALAKQHAKVSCITIIPGYDDTKIRTPGIDAKRLDGQTYEVLWEEAIEADPDWVVITSWNEWHEGSEIEPSWEDGDRYIKLTGEWARRFKQTPFSRVKVPEQPAGVEPEKAEALRKLYQGKTVGILPNYGGDAAFWLADTGVDIKELTWEAVLDADALNAEAIPIIVNAGGEEYVQTLEAEGDVERALQRYLQEGGLLVSLTFRPFPFYYNEQGESVLAASRFGLPIAGSGANLRDDAPEAAEVRGWEAPPPGKQLSFHVDTSALPGLSERVPFPKSGDLRWRPATKALTAEGDVYVSLAELKDEAGVSYGDGIAYIEHRSSEPKGGKALYAWMGMPDVLGRDELLFQLFRYAAAKAGE